MNECLELQTFHWHYFVYAKILICINCCCKPPLKQKQGLSNLIALDLKHSEYDFVPLCNDECSIEEKFIYLLTTFIKRVIHNLTFSEVLYIGQTLNI